MGGVMPDKIVTKKLFRSLFKKKLGDGFDRALQLFQQFGGKHSFEITRALTRAAELKKVPEALDALEVYLQQCR